MVETSSDSGDGCSYGEGVQGVCRFGGGSDDGRNGGSSGGRSRDSFYDTCGGGGRYRRDGDCSGCNVGGHSCSDGILIGLPSSWR